MRILLLTLNTNKNDAGPACSSTPWLNHGSLGCYQDIPDVFKIRDVYADLMSGFSSGLGIGLFVNKVDVPSGLPRQGT
jgi:hypothetical protein